MRVEKAKSRKASMRSRGEACRMVRVSHRRASEVPASVIADGFCEQMIQNLRHNVSESKRRLRQAVVV